MILFIISSDLTTATFNPAPETKLLQLVPNPVCVGCAVYLEKPLRIYDLVGRLVSTEPKAPHHPGTYIVKIKKGSGKMVVIN